MSYTRGVRRLGMPLPRASSLGLASRSSNSASSWTNYSDHQEKSSETSKVSQLLSQAMFLIVSLSIMLGYRRSFIESNSLSTRYWATFSATTVSFFLIRQSRMRKSFRRTFYSWLLFQFLFCPEWGWAYLEPRDRLHDIAQKRRKVVVD